MSWRGGLPCPEQVTRERAEAPIQFSTSDETTKLKSEEGIALEETKIVSIINEALRPSS